MKLIDGRAFAKQLRADLKERIESEGLHPGLGIILVGERPDSAGYVKMKKRACDTAGIRNFDTHFPVDVSEERVLEEVESMNRNPEIHAILVQLPLPDHVNQDRVLAAVDPAKDVDGFHPMNVGRLSLRDCTSAPCTPRGIMKLLEQTGVELSGANAVVIGRSQIVGLPTALLLMHANATVTIAHSRTRNLRELTRRADILVVAVGRPGMIRGEDVKDGVVVIDVGTTKLDGQWLGDVDFEEVSEKASWITPVPGGVGPMTIAMLLSATVDRAL